MGHLIYLQGVTYSHVGDKHALSRRMLHLILDSSVHHATI